MSARILTGDCRSVLATLPPESVHCVVTSPPYFGLRDYGVAGQMGLEATPDEFVAALVQVFREVRRVLRADGTLWLNLGDSYATGAGGVGECPGGGKQGESWKMRGAMTPPNRMPLPGLKPKDLCMVPARVALALQADGWWLRQDIIWHKPNPMPESVTDRCTKAHEYIFLLTKSARYYYDAAAIAEPSTIDSIARAGRADLREKDGWSEAYHGNPPEGLKRRESKKRGEFNAKPGTPEGREPFRAITEMRNKRSVWTVTTKPFSEAHFATFPPDLIEPCILAGCPRGGVVLDPFGGAGTTGLVAERHGRDSILIELNPEYARMARNRIKGEAPLFAEVA